MIQKALSRHSRGAPTDLLDDPKRLRNSQGTPTDLFDDPKSTMLVTTSSLTRGPNWPHWWSKKRYVTHAGPQLTSLMIQKSLGHSHGASTDLLDDPKSTTSVTTSSLTRGPNWPPWQSKKRYVTHAAGVKSQEANKLQIPFSANSINSTVETQYQRCQ